MITHAHSAMSEFNVKPPGAYFPIKLNVRGDKTRPIPPISLQIGLMVPI